MNYKHLVIATFLSFCGLVGLFDSTIASARPSGDLALECDLLSGNGGVEGVVVGSHGQGITNATIVFQHERGCIVKVVKSGQYGSYQVRLPSGRYIVTAAHPNYSPYTTAWCSPEGNGGYLPNIGFFVVTDQVQYGEFIFP